MTYVYPESCIHPVLASPIFLLIEFIWDIIIIFFYPTQRQVLADLSISQSQSNLPFFEKRQMFHKFIFLFNSKESNKVS